jgi:hypothetical protein
MTKRRILTLLCLVVCLMNFGLASKVGAYTAATQKPTGLTISPAFQQVNINLGTSSQPLSFSITNNKSTAQNLKLSTTDFNTLGESGGLFFVGANPTDLQKKYGLTKWLELPFTELTIQPGQTTTINAQVLNLASLNPGGHYGAINVSVDNDFRSTANNITIHPVASTLIFVTKLGGDTHKLSLANVKLHHSLFSLPASADLRFQNVGNTHLVPRGIIKILSPSGQVISQGTINENSDLILPQTFRIYTVPLRSIISANAPGKYKIEVDFRFDGVDQYRAYQTSFWYLPVVRVLVVCLVIIIIGLVIYKLLRRRKSKSTKHLQ